MSFAAVAPLLLPAEMLLIISMPRGHAAKRRMAADFLAEAGILPPAFCRRRRRGRGRSCRLQCRFSDFSAAAAARRLSCARH